MKLFRRELFFNHVVLKCPCSSYNSGPEVSGPFFSFFLFLSPTFFALSLLRCKHCKFYLDVNWSLDAHILWLNFWHGNGFKHISIWCVENSVTAHLSAPESKTELLLQCYYNLQIFSFRLPFLISSHLAHLHVQCEKLTIEKILKFMLKKRSWCNNPYLNSLRPSENQQYFVVRISIILSNGIHNSQFHFKTLHRRRESIFGKPN